MIRFKEFLREMAKLQDRHKEMTFYHGSNGNVEDILKTGMLKGRDIQGKYQLAPVKNKVYMTSHLHYAQIYAIGGNMAGHDWWPSSNKNDYGHVFEIKGHHLSDIQPDEDDVGSMSVRPAWGDRTEHDNNGISPYYKDLAKSVATPNQYHKASHGEMAPQAAIGKKMLKKMDDHGKLHFIDKGAHIAAEGPVQISRAWRIHKSKVVHLKKDGSNFFDHAEEIPIGNK